MTTTTTIKFDPTTSIANFEAYKTMANYFVDSKALPAGVQNAPQLVMVLQAGQDLGLTITEAMTSLAIINGRVSMYGEKVIQRVRDAGYKIELQEDLGEVVYEKDGKKYKKYTGYCTATILKSKDDKREEKYTMEDAQIG